MDYLSNEYSFVQAEAVSEIGSVAFKYSVESIPGLLDNPRITRITWWNWNVDLSVTKGVSKTLEERLAAVPN